MTHPRTLVMGVGNLLLGDEGAGIHIVRRLAERGDVPPELTVVDGGTGGFHLLSYLSDFDRIVMIDATMDGQPEGTLSLIEPRYASDFPRSLSAHDIGLKDLVESAALLGTLPQMHLLTVSVKDVQPMQVSLSPSVEESVPRAVERVMALVWALRSADEAALRVPAAVGA